MKVFGREPTLWLAVINSIVMFVGAFGLHAISGAQAALIVVAINAVFGVINVLTVRPIPPAAFTYAIGAILAVVASYGFTLSAEVVAGLNALVIPVLALITRDQVGPRDTPLTTA